MDDEAGREAVDVALTLLAEQGFDATSMAQIAAATGIPADEVERALGTKDEIVLTVAEEMLGSVVKALSEIDAQTPLVEALMTAHSSLLADIINDTGPVSLDRMRRMGKTITSSPDLQKKVGAQRVEMLTSVLADRFEASAVGYPRAAGAEAVVGRPRGDIPGRAGQARPLRPRRR